MASSAKAAPDPPTIAELAEQTRRSAPPPSPNEERDASFIGGYDATELRDPFDSILPATLDARALEEATPPAPFDLLNGRPSQVDIVAGPPRAHYLALGSGVAMLSLFALVAPRVRLSSAPSTEIEPHRMTPAQAAGWAAAPFTIEVPDESTTETTEAAPPVREADPPPHHFDVEAAAVALAEAKSSLSVCESGDEEAIPVSARVAVTFSPKGNVIAAEVDPPAEVGNLPDCVVSRLRAVRVVAFAGPSMTVHTTVTFVPVRANP
jgi:hypothetical protein